MKLKPRRWYTSPEVNPSLDPPPIATSITQQHLRYTARVPHQNGPVLNHTEPDRLFKSAFVIL